VGVDTIQGWSTMSENPAFEDIRGEGPSPPSPNRAKALILKQEFSVKG
jgi:hypothetical protein